MSDVFDFSVLNRRRNLPCRRFAAGEKIFLEEDAGLAMYFVRSGSVEIITFGTLLEVVGPGGIFGEMAVIDGGQRSAAAIAREPTELALIDQTTFVALVRDEPDFSLGVMALLVRRIRRMNASL